MRDRFFAMLCAFCLVVAILPATVLAADSGSHPIEITQTTGGTVTASCRSAAEGERVTLTVVPDLGYSMDTLYATCGGREAEGRLLGKENGMLSFELIMPGDTLQIEAVFVRSDPFPVRLIADGDPACGSITANAVTGYAGETITLTLEPAPGCSVEKAYVWFAAEDRTQSLKSIGDHRYTFTMTESYAEVHVRFLRQEPSAPAEPSAPEKDSEPEKTSAPEQRSETASASEKPSEPDVYRIFPSHAPALWALENGTASWASAVPILWRCAGCNEPK